MPNNDIVERLAGGIAHDVDVLLKAIVAHAESLSDHLSPGDPRAVKVGAFSAAIDLLITTGKHGALVADAQLPAAGMHFQVGIFS